MDLAARCPDTGRPPRGRATPGAALQGASALVAGLATAVTALLGAGGCGLETPQTPRFDTTFYVPIKQQIYTGQQMAAGLQAVAGDTIAPGPLTIQFSEPLDPITLDGEIGAGVRERAYTANLAAIDFTPPAVPQVSLDVEALLPAGAPGPGETGPVPAFPFGPLQLDLGSFASYTEVALAAGTLCLTLTNHLPFPIGGDLPDQALRVRLIDCAATPAAVVLEWVLAEVIPAGASLEAQRDLSGLVLSNRLGLEITGWSGGSGGEDVEIKPQMSLDLTLAFTATQVERLVGCPPALAASGAGEIEFADNCSISSARVSEGRLTCNLQSHLPVAATLTLEVPGLVMDGEPLRIVTTVGPYGVAGLDVDVAGAVLTRAAAGSWPLRLTVTTEPTSEPATVALGPAATVILQSADLRLAWIRGVMDHIAVRIAPLETPIDFPAGTEGVEFTAAHVNLLIRNHVAVAAEASLELQAAAGGDTVRVPITAMLPPGTSDLPAETRIELDETNSAIAALLGLRPAVVVLDGAIAIGDGVSEGEVRAGDYLDGQLAVLAPMRLVLETAHQQGDPFTVELGEDLREQVTGNLLTLSVDAQVENHFPTAVAITFHFARQEGALFVTDDLVLEAEPIACAPVDPTTGRVTASAMSSLTLSVTAGDIDLFAEERLFGGVEISLLGDGERPIEIWSTDYVKVRGVAAFRCRVE